MGGYAELVVCFGLAVLAAVVVALAVILCRQTRSVMAQNRELHDQIVAMSVDDHTWLQHRRQMEKAYNMRELTRLREQAAQAPPPGPAEAPPLPVIEERIDFPAHGSIP